MGPLILGISSFFSETTTRSFPFCQHSQHLCFSSRCGLSIKAHRCGNYVPGMEICWCKYNMLCSTGNLQCLRPASLSGFSVMCKSAGAGLRQFDRQSMWRSIWGLWLLIHWISNQGYVLHHASTHRSWCNTPCIGPGALIILEVFWGLSNTSPNRASLSSPEKCLSPSIVSEERD